MVIGTKKTYERTITQADVLAYGALTGDLNPAHFDEDYARTTIFKKPIVHGMLVASLFSKIFGLEYPGKGTIYCSQTIKFLKPVYPDEPLTVSIRLDRTDCEKNRAYFKTEVFNESKDCVLTGESMMMPPRSHHE
jgi:3-hydroxybutyryl-CoA dehydratase